MEAYTRQIIDSQLNNLGWVIKKNIFFEEPRTNEEKKKLEGKRPDYVIYSSNPNIYEPLAIIEAKTSVVKGLDGALDQASEYAKILGASVIFATDGSFIKTRHVKENKSLNYNGDEVDFFIKEELLVKFKEKAVVDDRPKEVVTSLSNLIKDFKAINKQLRKQGLTAGYERFSEFSTILFLKLFSEKIEQENDQRLPRIYSWNHLEKIPIQNWLDYLNNNIFPKISEIYNDEHIFSQSLKITNVTLFKNIYDKLNPLKLSYINNDIKGAAFEYFLANSPSSDKDLGEYFTPRHIVKFLVKLLNPKINEKVYDPFCGTGGMLIESFKHIWQTMDRNQQNINTLKEETLYGADISSNARIAKMNMILAGDGHNNIKQLDSLYIDNLKKVQGKMDVIITNFPFSQETDHKKFYDIESNGDSICLQHCIKALKDGGRMGIIVPEGVLFRKDMIKTREYLMKHCHIDYIISLPKGVFNPYTEIKTNILYCTKKQTKNNIWFYEVKNDGFSLDKKRYPLNDRSDLDKFLSFSKIGDEDKKDFGFIDADLDKIKENNYSLRLTEYKPIINSKVGLVSLKDLLEYEQPTLYLVNDTNYKDNYDTAVLTAGKSFILGYTNEKENIFSENLPVIIFDDFTTSIKYVDFPFKVKSSAMKILKNRNNEISNIKYIYHAMQGINFDNSTHKRYWISEYSKIKIPLPPLEKQNDIIKNIGIYEKVINGAKEVINNYNYNFNIDKEWQTVSIKDVVDFIDGYGFKSTNFINIKKSNTYGIIKIGNFNKNGELDLSNICFHNYDNSYKKYKLRKNDILIAMTGATIGKITLLLNEDNLLLNQRVGALRCKENINHKYLYLILLKNKTFYDYCQSISSGSAQDNISKKEILNFKIPLPTLNEQTEIVNQINKEEIIVNQNKELIKLMEQKIESVLNNIW